MASNVTLEGARQVVFFPFRGRNWAGKLAIGSALALAGSFIPLVPALPLAGYCLRIMKRVILEQADPELPEWNDWGGLFLDGLKLAGAILLIMLPALLTVVAGYVLFFVLNFGFALSTAGMASSSDTLDPGLFLGSMAGMVVGMSVIFIGFFLAIAFSLLLPPALGNLVARGEFGAAFRIREWWPVFKANLGGYFLAAALGMGLIYMLNFAVMLLYASLVLLVVLPFALAITSCLLGVIQASLYAVAYRDGVRRLAG